MNHAGICFTKHTVNYAKSCRSLAAMCIGIFQIYYTIKNCRNVTVGFTRSNVIFFLLYGKIKGNFSFGVILAAVKDAAPVDELDLPAKDRFPLSHIQSRIELPC